MSVEESVNNQQNLIERRERNLLSEIQSWRDRLVRRLLRIMSVLALLMFGVVAEFLVSNDLLPILPLVVISYLLVLGVAWAPTGYRLRLYTALGLLLFWGVMDLVIYGWGEDGRIMLMAFVVFAALFLGTRQSFVALSVVTGTMLLYIASVSFGWFVPLSGATFLIDAPANMISNALVVISMGVLVIVSLQYLVPRLVGSWEESVALSHTLEDEREDLSARTQALQQANLAFQRRAMYLEASNEISQALATYFELDPLLDKAVHLITDYFGFYHTGIFLMDDTGEWAVLRAASSVGGRKMLARGHQLRRGGDSMVGWVSEHRQSRIAADVGEDAVHFANPDLPATRSEVALPLIVSNQLLGVLNVQSTEEAAFDQDDVRALQSLAGQLSVAVDNARRMSDEAALLEAANPFYRMARRLATTRNEREIYTAIMETIRDFNPARAFFLARQDDVVRLVAEMRMGEMHFPEVSAAVVSETDFARNVLTMALPLEAPLMIEDLKAPEESLSKDLLEQIVAVAEQLDARSLALIPVRVDMRLLGVLLLSYATARRFSSLEDRLYRVLADLSGVALERTQLVQDAQTRLRQERWMREFGEQMMRVPDVQTIVRRAAEALQGLADADSVLVALEAPEQDSKRPV